MSSAIELVVDPRERDLGGFTVRRMLPDGRRRAVGPFVFFDHMGPADFAPGQGIDVRPHPHIGLATVTYLFEGELLHRDSLGSVQPIRPGDVNWMSAGRGISHSERTGPETRAAGSRLHGIQAWVGLLRADEDGDPGFWHHPAATLPRFERDGAMVTVIAGTLHGYASPVATRSPLFYADARLAPGSRLNLGSDYSERALHVAEGEARIDGARLSAGRMAILAPGAEVRIEADADARVMLLGGEPLDGERFLWWNFVASDRGRIEAAKRAWAEQRFAPIPGETEYIPLPDDRRGP